MDSSSRHSAKTVYLLRHGDVQDGCQGRYCGALDIALSPAGIQQCQALGRHLRTWPIGQVLCSPLQRARQSAAALGRPGEICEPLREIDFGDWEGLSFAEIQAGWPAEVSRWSAGDLDFGFPNGETLAAFSTRIGQLGDALADGDQECLLLVTHGGVIRALICHWLGLEWRHHLLFQVPTASLTHIELFGRRGVLRGLGLRPLEALHGA